MRAEDRIRLLMSEGRTRTVPMEEGKLRLFGPRMDQRIADAEQARSPTNGAMRSLRLRPRI